MKITKKRLENMESFVADDLLNGAIESSVLTIGGQQKKVFYRAPSVSEISDLQDEVNDEDASNADKNATMARFVAAHLVNEDGSALLSEDQALKLAFPVMKDLLDVLVDSKQGEA